MSTVSSVMVMVRVILRYHRLLCIEIQPDEECHPYARWGTPENLERLAVFLASDASDFVNGHILYVDGGILAYIGNQP